MRWFRTGSGPVEETAATPPVLFVHVMKAGGTTITRNLRETFRLDEIYPAAAQDLAYTQDGELDVQHHLTVPYLQALPPERRQTIRVYIGHFPYVVRELLGFEVLAATLLRDPVERTISLLRQLKRTQPWEEASERRPLTELPLEEVYEHPMVFGPLIHDHQTKVFSMTRADEPQTYMDLIDVDSRRLALAKANLAEVEVLGTMEHFGDFLDETQERFGWKVVRGARKNATPEADLTPVDPALRRRIAADNAIDLELYEHAKELVEARIRRRRVGA
jgi:hypothetical protein